MRYYEIVITPVPDAKGNTPPALIYSTMNGVFENSGALRVDLDIYQSPFHQPTQSGALKIYGVDFFDLSQATNLNPDYSQTPPTLASIQISVGMSTGLPFANASQKGLIINGSILQAFGNWQGNLVTLDLIVTSATFNPNINVNLSWNWAKQYQTMENAIRTTLGNAYPTIPIASPEGSLNPNLVSTELQAGKYDGLYQFSDYVNKQSQQIINQPDYFGVFISPSPLGFVLADGTVPPEKTTVINYTDIIGNLTWIDLYTIQAKLVMRSDLNIGDNITFPLTSPVVNVAASTYPQLRNNISFQGTFNIQQIHHLGSSRQASGNDWVTVVNAVFLNV